jgi:monovalent cation:H+ antiporter, CPA1 family
MLAVPASIAERGQIVVITFGVVAFSIFAQGLTMPRLLRRWQLTGSDEAEH